MKQILENSLELVKVLKINSHSEILETCKNLVNNLENYKKFYDSLSKAIKECSPEF